ALLAESLERNPPRRIREAGAVLVAGRADLLRPRCEVAHQRLHLRIPVGVRRRHDPNARGEPVEDAAEILPEMLDPVRMAANRILHIDEPPARELPSVLLRELGHLGLFRLPLVLRVQDQALEGVPALLPKRTSQKV